MKLSKKIISIFLCASVLSSCTITAAATKVMQVTPETTISDEVCPGFPKDKDGRYFNIDCEKEKAVRSIKKGAGYVKVTSIGSDGKYDLYVFDYPSISNFISCISNIARSYSNDMTTNQILSQAAHQIRFLFGLNSSEAEEVVSVIYKQIINDANKTIPYSIKNPAIREAIADDKSIRHWSWGGAAAGAVVIGGATAAVVILCPPVAAVVAPVAAKIGVAATAAALGAVGGAEAAGHGQSEAISDKHFEEYKSNKVYVQNCVSAVNQILSTIANEYWKYKDSISVLFFNDISRYSATVSNNKIGINYTQEQKKVIEDIFEDAKEPLKAFLDKYDEH